MAGPTSPSEASTPALFSPTTLGGSVNPVELKHRIVMAPLTRMRTGEEGIPGPVVALHYEQRATDGGLLISEATNISPTARGYFGAPGLFDQRQVEGWKHVTQRVHVKGGKIFCQLWHTGRVGHPLNQPGEVLPVSSSATSMEDVTSHAITREGRKDHVTPRALELEELPQIVQDYKTAATNAIAAGFDGVEIHSANGYLLEQFLCDKVNKRTDAYGGSLENRARLIFEVVEGVLSAVPSSQVGIRLSPYGITFGCTDSNPAETYEYVVSKLNAYNLAYLHLVEPRVAHFKGPLVPEGGITSIYRKLFTGVLITSSGYDREEALRVVEQGGADLVAFGRDFIHNPDLVERLRVGAPLNEGNPKTYYVAPGEPLETGYTDYPFLQN
jgi:N-ethylmaleimide reductase